jgi:hypothetical protein
VKITDPVNFIERLDHNILSLKADSKQIKKDKGNSSSISMAAEIQAVFLAGTRPFFDSPPARIGRLS